MSMRKEVKEKWLQALRSGEYKQGKNCLRADDKFCCLGVLTDIYAKEKNVEWRGNVFLGKKNVLPQSVATWAGIFGAPKVAGVLLSAHNDRESSTFEEISNLIEENL